MNSAQNDSVSVLKVILGSIKELRDTCVAFVAAPRVLWGVNLANIIEGLVYFGVLTILGKFCSENLNLSDLQAGWVYGFVTGGITFAMLLFGGVSDRIGVRNSLILSFAGMLIGRILIASSGSFHLSNGVGSPMFFLMIAGIFVMVVAYGLFQPAIYSAVKKYASPAVAPMAYAALYGGMNLGSFLSGFISPLTRQHFEKTFPPNGLTSVFWVYAVLTFISLLIIVLLVTKKQDAVVQADVVVGASDDSAATESIWKKFLSTFDPLRDKRFLFFIFMLIPVQTLFAHNWLTIPYYLDRAYAGTSVSRYYEFFSNLNPLIIFILSPLVAGLTLRANVYNMMILGTTVMALPTFLIALGTNVYLFLTYIVLMSVGEAMWSPRFLQWVAEIAPKGKIGAYQGVGQFPWFLTKLITSTFSGYFVATYLPKAETGLPVRPQMMWLIYGLIAMITPIGLMAAKKWMKQKSSFEETKETEQGLQPLIQLSKPVSTIESDI
ncbi:MAG: MFS transporter [Oligoflexia bacterium]|nr:MFS transporter [Oligoflexia bacterium]